MLIITTMRCYLKPMRVTTNKKKKTENEKC